MIDILGQKLTVFIVICLLVTTGLGGLVYYAILPTKNMYEQESKSILAKTQEISAKVDQLRFDFDSIQTQIDQFRFLEKKGFFNAQDRITTRESIESITRKSGLVEESTEVTFSPAQVIENENARKANHTLIAGPMVVKFAAMTEADVYRYMLTLERAFPGYLQFRSFSINRLDPKQFDDQMKRISAGEELGVVQGTVDFLWWTMASQEQMQATPLTNPLQVTAPPSLDGQQGGP